jgi:hypothetical protein
MTNLPFSKAFGGAALLGGAYAHSGKSRINRCSITREGPMIDGLMDGRVDVLSE